MAIYSIKREKNSTNSKDQSKEVIEFFYNEKEIIILTGDDADQIVLESAILENNFIVKYDNTDIKINLVTVNGNRAKHQPDRLKFMKGKEEIGARKIHYGYDDKHERGSITIDYGTGKDGKFNSEKDLKTKMVDAVAGMIYHMIDDIEDYRNGSITSKELEARIDKDYNSLTTGEKDKIIKKAKGTK